MPGASLRNAIPRKINKERAQPSGRKHLGFLEKHKDYILRARDFQRKKKAITSLKRKASFRNPDEFYFAMHNSQTKGGVHELPHEDASLPHDYIHLLKTQDMAYINMKRSIDLKRAEKMRRNLHGLQEKPVNRRRIFVDTLEDAETFEASEGEKIAAHQQQQSQARQEGGIGKQVAGRGHVLKDIQKAYREMEGRAERSEKLRRIGARMQVERDVMGKGRKRKVCAAEDGRPAVWRWKRERRK